MKIKNPKHIVISRTDSIGDVVLTLPMAGILKEKFPEVKITFLGNAYTAPIVRCCEHIDEIWEWGEFEPRTYSEQIEILHAKKIDVFIHVFPRRELARVVKKAGIKHRIGTSHRIFHLITCNHRPSFTRKRSDLHESQLNIKLLQPFGINKSYNLAQLQKYAGFKKMEILEEKWQKMIENDRKTIIFHPKSKGSALEWGIDNYIELAKKLEVKKYKIFFTGTEAESEYFRSKLPQQENIVDLSGKMSLNQLIAFIAKADLLLAASTGPLHIAGISGITAVGLFSTIKPIHAGRWKPLGSKTKILEDKKNSASTQPLAIAIRDVKKVIDESL